MTDRRPEAGFTLVEVLLAVLLAGLAMVGSYAVAAQVMRLSEEAGSRLAAQSAEAVLRLALTNDLGSVIYVEKARSDATTAMIFTGGQSAADGLSEQNDQRILSLATAASLDPDFPFPSHGFNRVDYVLRTDDATTDRPSQGAKAVRLIRRERLATTVPRRTGAAERIANETVLAERIVGPELSFYGPNGSGPSASWNSEERNMLKKTPLPAQVRFTATLIVSGRRFPVDIRIDLPSRSVSGAKS